MDEEIGVVNDPVSESMDAPSPSLQRDDRHIIVENNAH